MNTQCLNCQFCGYGRPVLKTNVYDILGGFTDRMIHSDILGKAFEPEQRFENPDGTPITFNRDYFGAFRRAEVIPGPFATSASEIEL